MLETYYFVIQVGKEVYKEFLLSDSFDFALTLLRNKFTSFTILYWCVL